MSKLGKLINFLENSFQGGLILWFFSFFSIIVIRLFVESFIFGFSLKSSEFFLVYVLHTFFFFSLTYLVILTYIKLILKNEVKKIASVLLWGFWIVIFPPVIDKLYYRDTEFFDFYLFDGLKGLFVKFFTFFGDNILMGITIGPRVQVFLVLMFLGVYFYYYKKNWLKTAFFVLGGYFLFFILASMPSVIVLFLTIFSEKSLLDVTYNEVSGMFLSPIRYFSYEGKAFFSFMGYKLSLFYTVLIFLSLILLQFISSKDKLKAIFKNIRYPQVIFNWGIFLIGVGLGWFYFPEYFKLNLFSVLVVINLLVIILLIWVYSVVINDLFDFNIDKITNTERPLIKGIFSEKEYYEIGIIFLLMALFFSILIGFKFFIIIIIYAFLTWVYSSKPFRFKRFFPIAVIISSFSSLLFLGMGYILIAKEQSLLFFPWKIFWFLFLAYCLVIPIKDFKDIESDRLFGVKTLPVLIGEERARFFLATLMFLCYILSVYITKESGLFLIAVLFGGISFWLIIDKKNTTNQLNWWLIGLVSLYSFFILSFIF